MLKMECTFAHFPLGVHNIVEKGDEISVKIFLLLYHTPLGELIPDLPVLPAEAVGARQTLFIS